MPNLSAAQIKFVKSLQQKKFRQKYGLFVVEGLKVAQELVHNSLFDVQQAFGTIEVQNLLQEFDAKGADVTVVNETELARISGLKSPQSILLVLEQKSFELPQLVQNQLYLVLDSLQDPGNLGTIIRTADWFGVQHIFCSPTTADQYNPKVVQATMGSLFRVQIHRLDLSEFLPKVDIPIYGALLGGVNLYEHPPKQKGCLMIGNEGKGIHPDLIPLVTHQIEIPKIGGAESLNAAIATGILLNEFARIR